MNESKSQSPIHVFHYLARVVYGAHILNKLAAFRTLIHKQVLFAELAFGDCFRYL